MKSLKSSRKGYFIIISGHNILEGKYKFKSKDSVGFPLLCTYLSAWGQCYPKHICSKRLESAR